MRELLPGITIKPATQPRDFVRRIQALLENSAEFSCEFHENFAGYKEHDILDVTPTWETSHKGLFGQVIYNPEYDGDRVRIEIRAHRWEPHPPGYNDYVEAARQIFRPILSQYNRIYDARLRLNIQSAHSLEPEMSSLIERYYLRWVNGPDLLGHPLDCNRFCQFVKSCLRYSRRKRDLSGSWLGYFLDRDFRQRIVDDQAREEVISEAAILFEHLIDFSKVSFPDHVLEMRNPYLVKLSLEGWVYPDGRPVYPQEKIERILAENFGESWREDYLKKIGLR